MHLLFQRNHYKTTMLLSHFIDADLLCYSFANKEQFTAAFLTFNKGLACLKDIRVIFHKSLLQDL